MVNMTSHFIECWVRVRERANKILEFYLSCEEAKCLVLS